MRSLFLTSLFLLLAVPASARTRRHTVLDYYKILPERFFNIDNPNSSAARLKWLRGGAVQDIPANNRSIIDIRHDFLRVPGDGAQSGLDVAVFRFRGQETVAVRERSGEDEELSFWRLQLGHLVEVTRQVFPSHFGSDSDTVITVPRYGTTIRASRRNKSPQQKPVLFVWRGGRFVRE